MQINETMIRNVVSQVLAEVVVPGSVNTPRSANGSPNHGVFYDANEAVDAAHVAFEKLQERSMEDRKRSSAIFDAFPSTSLWNWELWRWRKQGLGGLNTK